MTLLPLDTATFVCCRMPILEEPVAIPALMQVRWTVERKNKDPYYLSGLRFVTN